MTEGRFSERHGFKKVREAFQLEALDAPTRTALWNVLVEDVFSTVGEFTYLYNSTDINVLRVRALWDETLGRNLDDLNFKKWHQVRPTFWKYIEQREWHEVYDFLEAVIELLPENSTLQARIRSNLNRVLERFSCGYRILGSHVTPITSEVDLAAIANARDDANRSVAEHITAALALMSNRSNPDYRNSIKESISAVEAMSREVSGKPKAALTDALRSVKTRYDLHPALEAAFKSLYGYTSDASGIRHALIDAPAVGAAEARFMLVACSAFCNFLRENAAT